ncbi:MurR/RpiR family transcriptional regulator [Paenibacillus sp. 19GGS1-52]|uniref:MurR/RpiR family transcriptional regulator n=1 Tax=Paenibacillus sp. 19GGS1-52 TaxID=2758563 RepID=UPI001EFC1AB7|nr:MurR/RpiR family transcriptional regulator [Paenibacillus sp. 19GGS1-52]ULO09424.1 MurR/RpiR family transcriptional regulator [Paenibacillus sp. 19GGS1-52]
MSKFGKPINSSSTLLMISSIYNSLSKAEKKVADAVQSDPEYAVLATVTDLAEKAKVGETSVIRFCRKIGFRGYHEFKLSVAQDLVNVSTYIDEEIEEEDDWELIARKLTMNHTKLLDKTLDLIDMDTVSQAVEALAAANRVFVYGVGSSGITALDTHYRFMRIGLNVDVQRDIHILAMSAALVKAGDVVFGISTSGSTKDVVAATRMAKESGALIICLTSHARSPITTYADIVLLVPSKEMPFQGGALSTKIAQIHLIDILSTLLTLHMKDSAYAAIKKTADAVADKLY